MLKWLKNLFFEDRTFGALRSSQWKIVRRINIKDYCELCEVKGGLLRPLELHHVKPYHLFPELELEPSNFITVCRPCHLRYAHLSSFHSYCLDIKELAREWQERRRDRP